MAMIAFFGFFLCALQAYVCRCTILGMLAVTCLVSSIQLAATSEQNWWVRILTGLIPMTMLCILIYRSFGLDMLYLGRISEYRFAIVEASLIFLLHIISLFPERKGDIHEIYA